MDIFGTLNRLQIIPFLKNWRLLKFVLGIIDILVVALAFQCAYFIRYFQTGGFFFSDLRLLKLFILITPFWMVFLYLIQIAEIPRTKHYKVLFFEYLQSALLVILFLLIFYFVFKLYEVSRIFLIEFTLIGFLFLFLVRILEYKIFKIYRAKGYNFVNIVLIADDTSTPFIDSLILNKEWGYRIVAIFTGSDAVKNRYEKTTIMLPEKYTGVLNDLMEVDLIDEVLYIKNKVVPSEVRETVRSCEELGVTFRLKYKDTNLNLTNAVKTDLADEKFLTFINVPHNSFALTIKKIMDISVSLIMILVLSPALIIIGAIIKLTSPGPAIFRQARVGLRGRKFYLYKFRTMVVNAESIRKDLGDMNEMDGPVFKIKDDPRVTRIGKFLRKTGLDELPQLFNILKGEMSLIGPRPPLQSETLQYKRWQLRRLSVKPGLSCFWQIKPERNTIKFEQWMEMDLAYIDNWSLRLDFIILLKTIKTVFHRTGL
jgi:exopolysaccharide biosynthesis polyprenyl glycosylphosphotransferase